MNSVCLEKALSIDGIFESVDGSDVVITADPALADALNHRIESPTLGKFAYTPRQYVREHAHSTGLKDRMELFLSVARRTDLDWKRAYYFLNEILSCWQETGGLENILSYETEDEDGLRKVLEVLEEERSIFSELESYRINSSTGVTAVGLYQFTELDRSILPASCRSQPVFQKKTDTLPPFQMFSSYNEIVNALTSAIDRENAHDVAVVVDPESEYRPLIESAFRAEDIPYISKTSVRDQRSFRTFLQLLKLSLNGGGLRLKEVRPVLNALGINISHRHDEKLLGRSDADELRSLLQIMEETRERSLKKSLQAYSETSDEQMGKTRELLDLLGYLDKQPSYSLLKNLEFFLRMFPLEERDSKSGVLLVSPVRSAYVDRPVVFYLGLGTGWTRGVPNRSWIQREQEREDHFKTFQICVQNGSDRYFFVQEKIVNDVITPCFYLNRLLPDGTELESFSDISHEEKTAFRKEDKKDGFERKRTEVQPGEKQTLSQSELNKLVISPRDFFFSELVETPDNYYFRRGNLFHDFAEFYLNHSQFVQETEREKFVNIMMNQMEPFVDEHGMEQERLLFWIGIKSLMDYLPGERIDEVEVEGYRKSTRRDQNIFARSFGKELYSPISEARFRDGKMGVRGVVDYIASKTELVDFKTGRRYSPRRIMERSSRDPVPEDPDYQALLYLTYHNRCISDSPLTFSFYYLLENNLDYLWGEPEISDNLTQISYVPESISDWVIRKKVFERLKKTSKKRKEFLEQLGYPRYREFFKSHSFPNIENRTDIPGHAINEKFEEFAIRHTKDTKTYRRECTMTLKKLVKFKNEQFFLNDVREFRAFVKDQLENVNQYLRDGFPLIGEVEELDLDTLEHRDLIMSER